MNVPPVEPLRRLIYNTAAFARQYPAGDGSVYYRCIKQPVNDWLLTHHLDGRDTLATYLVAADRHARVGVIDFDTERGQAQAVAVSARLKWAASRRCWKAAGTVARTCGCCSTCPRIGAGCAGAAWASWPRPICMKGRGVSQEPGTVRVGGSSTTGRASQRKSPNLAALLVPVPDGTPVGQNQSLDIAIALNLAYWPGQRPCARNGLIALQRSRPWKLHWTRADSTASRQPPATTCTRKSGGGWACRTTTTTAGQTGYPASWRNTNTMTATRRRNGTAASMCIIAISAI